MGRLDSKSKLQKRTISSALYSSPLDLPPTKSFRQPKTSDCGMVEHAVTVFRALSGEVAYLVQELRSKDKTIRDLEAKISRKITNDSERRAPIAKVKYYDYETKIDGMLLAVEDRERELHQALAQKRAGQQYKDSVIAALHQEIATLKRILADRPKDANSEEKLKRTENQVADNNLHTNLLKKDPGKVNVSRTVSPTHCQGCKDRKQQFETTNPRETAERGDLAAEVYALEYLVDFYNSFIDSLHHKLLGTNFTEPQILPNVDSGDKETGTGSRWESRLQQRSTGDYLISVAINQRLQMLKRRSEDLFQELILARSDLLERPSTTYALSTGTHRSMLEAKNSHVASLKKESDSVRTFWWQCYRISVQYRTLITKTAPESSSMNVLDNMREIGSSCYPLPQTD